MVIVGILNKKWFSDARGTYRYVLGADNYNWILLVQKNNNGERYEIISYFGNMKLLFGYFYNEPEIISNLFELVISKSGFPRDSIDFKPSDREPLLLGKWLDDTCETSFLRECPPPIAKKLKLGK